MDWDDFKFFSAVARHGSVRAAARDLRVHPSTVTRRVEHFEARLGVKLFARTARGLVLTPSGAGVVRDLEHVERDLSRIERSLKEEDLAYAGEVRVAVPEFLLVGGVFEAFDGFVGAYPDIAVDWLLAPADAAFSAGAADLGVQVTSEPPLDLVGRKVGTVGVSVYGGESGLDATNRHRTANWIEWRIPGALGEACAAVRAGGWAGTPVVSRCYTLSQSVALLRAGVGISALPCVVGDREPGLRRLSDAPVETGDLWMLTAPEMRYVRRVRVLGEHVSRAINTHREQLAGQNR